MPKPIPLPPKPTEPEREERLAVNLFDLDRLDPILRKNLLASRLDLSKITHMKIDKAVDEAAVEFHCSLLTAALVCDNLRSHDREMGDPPTRIYIKKREWSRVPPKTVLTIVVKGKARLNPQVFPVDVRPEDLVAPPVRRLDL